ncbi:MAG: SAM-dependent methyltransferase, partial [Elusimicrobiota bacterium]
MKKEKRLIICSYGLEPKHITLETLAELKKCGVVFSHSLEAGAGGLVARSCKKFECLRGLTAAGITASLKKAFAEHDTVGFLTYGNPLFLNATTALIKAGMAAARVKVSVLPAVSSFDSIVNLLDLNKFSLAGLRIVDLAACMDDLRITPEMDTLFFVAGDLNLKGKEKYRAAFFKGLAAAYPGAHPATIVNCP